VDQLVSMISEKFGLPADKAQEVIGMVMNFVGDKLPEPIASQVTGLLDGDGVAGGAADAVGGATDAAGGMVDKMKDGLGGLLGGGN